MAQGQTLSQAVQESWLMEPQTGQGFTSPRAFCPPPDRSPEPQLSGLRTGGDKAVPGFYAAGGGGGAEGALPPRCEV
jgi:hypothetical protein